MGATNEPKDVVMSYIEALDGLNYDGALRFLSDDVRIRGPAGETFGVPKGFIAMLRKYRGRYEVKRVFADGDDVSLWYDLKTGGQTVFMASWYHVRGGKITSIQTIFDPGAFDTPPAKGADGGAP